MAVVSRCRFAGGLLAILATCIAGSTMGATITFDEVILPSNSPITDQYAALGVEFANAYYDVQGWDVATGRHIASFSPSVTNSYFDLLFTADVVEVSFLFLTNRQDLYAGPPGQTVFMALLDDDVVSQFVGDTDLTLRPFGFSGIRFDQVRIFPGGWGNFGRLDNLQFTTVPEPSAIGVASTAVGFMGIWAALRRRFSALK